jgi:hypothetical protein
MPDIGTSIDAIILGDVVEHTNSRRRGCVIGIERANPDGTIEYRVRPARDATGDIDVTSWNSARVARVAHRDPHRRYIAMVAAEDSLARRGRRPPPEGRREWAILVRMFGPNLPDVAWDRMYWRLTNLRHIDPGGAYVAYDLGRGSWGRAAIDCLERRDRAARWHWR